jgi:alpha-1,3-glucosyltransferase
MEKAGGVSPAFRASSRLSGIGEATNEMRGPSESTTAGGMGRRWVRWMHEQGIKAWVVPIAVLIATWVKWAIGLGTYSGVMNSSYCFVTNNVYGFDQGNATPPMYGDYEAQRHWMELTIHLPFRQWYTYDLQYWGLDYPPLTAYISWICGYV